MLYDFATYDIISAGKPVGRGLIAISVSDVCSILAKFMSVRQWWYDHDDTVKTNSTTRLHISCSTARLCQLFCLLRPTRCTTYVHIWWPLPLSHSPSDYCTLIFLSQVQLFSCHMNIVFVQWTIVILNSLSAFIFLHLFLSVRAVNIFLAAYVQFDNFRFMLRAPLLIVSACIFKKM